MNVVRKFTEGSAPGVRIVNRPEDLSIIHRPDCAALVWHRPTLATFQAWIDSVQPALLPHARAILRPVDAREAVSESCERSGLPPCPNRAKLIEDIATLATIFAELVDAPFLRLRLEKVTTNACRKFHMDALTARLVCTYRGTGTQYGISSDGDDPQSVFTVPTSAPILLHGTEWPGAEQSGLLHRSPPIEGTGETRLVLVLDPIEDPGEEV